MVCVYDSLNINVYIIISVFRRLGSYP